ncbi:MAG: hypothetical protein AB8G17_01465 [Gammaproteobacteria bacterium]
MKLKFFWLVSLFLAHAAAATPPTTPERFLPVVLNQDGRVTLSPGFSPDGQTMYFAQSACTPIWECPQTLHKSTKSAEGWTRPSPVALPLDGRVDWPAVSPDGTTLLFSWSAEREEFTDLDIFENFDLYTLDLTNPDAVPAPIIGGDINRPRAGTLKTLRFMHNETLPSLTSSGSLYFMTERPDGIGERDIYVAQRGESGHYDVAVPVSGPVNSRQRDDGVWVNAEETLMLLSSPDRGGQGGSDLYLSARVDGNWAEPMNLGPTYNTPHEEFAARLTPDGRSIVFTSDRPFAGQDGGLLQVWFAEFDVDEFLSTAGDAQR